MPGNPSFSCFRDETSGNLSSEGVSLSGKTLTIKDGGDKVECSVDLTGSSAADAASKHFSQPISEHLAAGLNVNFIALNGQDFLFQDGGTKQGLVHHLLGDVFSAAEKADGTSRVQVAMIDVKRNKLTDLLSAGAPGASALRVNASDGERVPSVEGAAVLSVNSAAGAAAVVDAALNRRAQALAQGGLKQVVHTILQVHVSHVSASSQKNAVLTFLNVETATEQGSLQFSAMAQEYANGNKKHAKSADNVLCQAVRTSLGGNARMFAFGAVRSGLGVGAAEITAKTLGALAAIKDTASAKDFKPDAALQDDKQWSASIAATQNTVLALWPADAVKADGKRGTTPHLLSLHTDRLANERTAILMEGGSKRAGRSDAKVKQDLILTGLGIQAEHCTLANMAGKLTVAPAEGASVTVNGSPVVSGSQKTLEHNDRVRLGAFQTFRVVIPGKVGPGDEKFDIVMAETEVQSAAKAAQGSSLSSGDLPPEQQDKIEKLLPMVNEANNMSEELKRDINFMLKMVATQTKAGTGSDVQVQVTYDGNQEALWDADMFLDRVYEMRDIYDQFISRGRDLMYVNSTYTGSQDPFAKPSGEAVVGRAMIYLDAVNHLLAVHETTPIIDYKGFSRGELKVELDLELPNVGDKEMASKFDELERVEKLKGKQLRIKLKVLGIRGLPSNMCQEAYVSFRFFLDEKPMETPKEAKKTINPKFNFEHSWNLVVTDELCNYLASDVLEFVVYAKSSTEGGASKAQEAEATAAAKEKDPAAQIDEDTLNQLQEKEEQLQELKFQLTEQKMEMERKMREANGGVPGSESKTADGKTESVEELKEHIEFLEQKIETLETQKKQLEVQVEDAEDDLNELNQRLDDDEETMQQQLTKIQDLEQQLADAKKSKACAIL